MGKNKKTEKKCIGLHLPIDLLGEINVLKEKLSTSQNELIINLIEKGLGILNLNNEQSRYFFVRVRIDATKMIELGQKLQNGELDNSNIIMTFCLQDDPSIGLNFWKAKNRNHFDEIFACHKPYYKDIMEITEVITPLDAMKKLIKKNQ